ncbi:MAG: oligosaccharide flippase family protein [Treponema sp.]|nr:oligosaccharide flippase family protein [Treponema sp.]
MKLQNDNRKLIVDFLMYFIGTVIPMIVGLISVPIMTRYFTPEEYGINSIIDTTFNYFTCLTFSVLGSICWRFYYKYKNNNNVEYFLNFLYTLFLLYSLIVGALTFIYILFEHNSHIRCLILFKLCLVLLSGWVGVEFIVLRHNGKSVAYSLSSSFITLLSFVFLYILTYILHLRNEALYFSSFLIYLVFFIFFYCKRKYRIINIFKSKDDLKEFLSFAYFNIFTSFLAVVLVSCDRYMIKFYETFDAVGIYDKAYNIGERIIYALATMFFNVYNPIIYKTLSEKNEENIRQIFQNITITYILFLLPITIVFSLFSKSLVKLFLGPSFQIGYIIIPFVAFGYFFDRFTSSLYGVAINFKNVKLNLIGTLIAAILNFFLNYFLIPRTGILGASIATLTSYLFIFLYSLIVTGFFKLDIFVNNNHVLILYIILAVYMVMHFIIALLISEKIIFQILNAVFFAILYYSLIIKYVKHGYLNIQKSNV